MKGLRSKGTKEQRGTDPDTIRREEQAARETHSQEALQTLFARWEKTVEQVHDQEACCSYPQLNDNIFTMTRRRVRPEITVSRWHAGSSWGGSFWREQHGLQRGVSISLPASGQITYEGSVACIMMQSRRCQCYLSVPTGAVYLLQAFVHSRAINNALEQLLALPDPSALKPRLTSFLEALLQEHSTRPGKLACAAVELAAFAVKDKSQASIAHA